MESNRKNHWDTVYETKQPNEVSWTQENPKTSIDFIRETHLGKSAKIIDIGGGDSKLVDFLLDDGYENVTVLDISEKALERAKKRLGKNAEKVNWIVSDITEFEPKTSCDIWHDRATFHFLTTAEQIKKYVEITEKYVNGFLIIGTFSENGPKKCSGLEIKQYSEMELEKEFSNNFKKLKCIAEDHTTPFEKIQNFTFCAFEKIK
jgi:SAM-dependent methyltransferase